MKLKLYFQYLYFFLFTSFVFAQRLFAGQVSEVIDGRIIVVEISNKNKITVQLQYIEVPGNYSGSFH